jgi:hypothetical protein
VRPRAVSTRHASQKGGRQGPQTYFRGRILSGYADLSCVVQDSLGLADRPDLDAFYAAGVTHHELSPCDFVLSSEPFRSWTTENFKRLFGSWALQRSSHIRIRHFATDVWDGLSQPRTFEISSKDQRQASMPLHNISEVLPRHRPLSILWQQDACMTGLRCPLTQEMKLRVTTADGSLHGPS